MATLLAHQKQYVLGPGSIPVRPDWISVELAEGLVLSHCPKLSVRQLRSRDGMEYWLLGLAVPADQPATSVPETFPLKDSADIEKWTGFWAGKWLLVSKECCWQDASGALGVNYRHTDGYVWISSSPALLSDHLPNIPSLPRIPWRVAHPKGIEWIPAPFTAREGIYKLLPQRAINPRTGSVRPVRFVPPNRDMGGVPEALASTLKTILANWARCDFSDWLMGLTAGLDTRTVLAAAHAAEIQVRTFTSSYPFMDKRDRILPPRLAACIGVDHVFQTAPALDPAEVKDRLAAISEHMDGATSHPVFAHFAHYDHGRMNDRGQTHAHGNCFEVGRCFYWPRFSRAGLAETRPTADQLLDAFAFHSTWRPEPIEVWRQAIQSWIESLSDPVPLALDWRDRFYLDQRLGSWHCNVQRTNDFIDSTRFYPANCLWIFHLLLQPDPMQRRDGFTQREAIRLMAPRLLKIPINPRPIRERLKRTARTFLGPKAAHKLKSLANAMKLR